MALRAILMLVVAAPSAALSNDCTRRLATAVHSATTNGVPDRCWRIGPLVLGISLVEVERALGKPVTRLASGDHVDMLYVFPKRPGPLVMGGRASFRQVQLRFRNHRLVLIDDDPGYVSETRPRECQGDRNPLSQVVGSALAGPALNLAGIKNGDPIRLTRTRFGTLPNRNRSHDWYNYLPVPISFTVDPDTDLISGIAMAQDSETLTGERPAVHLLVHAAPTTCRLTAIDFTLADYAS